METHYSPLSFDAQTSSRIGNLPDVLQAGSPVSLPGLNLDSAPLTSYQPSSRYDVSPAMAPERRRPRHQYSVSSINSDDSASRRLSLPTTLQPASDTAYRVEAPLLHSGSTDNVGPQNHHFVENESLRPRSLLPGRLASTQSTIGKLLSRRPPSTNKRYSWRAAPDKYTIVEERADNRHHVKMRHLSSESSEWNEMDRDIGYDISSLEGPVYLRPLSTSRGVVSDMQTQGTLAAEFHQLEAGGNLTGGLGGGMVLGAKLQVNTPSSLVGSSLSQLAIPSTGGIARGNTIRDVGLNEAKKRGEIVAIREIVPRVDLSSLGGTDHTGNEGDGNGESLHNVKALNQEKQSYFYPADPDMPNWRPFTMRRPYIVLLVLISLGLAGVQEFLYQKSIRYARQDPPSAVLEFATPQDVTLLDFFCWKYLPTIIFVSYGVLWQITDYQIKRLEPFYQLSQRTGSTAAESLNMNYLTFYNFLTPFKAARFKQWAVLYSALGTLMATTLAPTFQNASLITERTHHPYKHDIISVRIDPVWSRLLTATLITVAVFGVLLFFKLRRKSGLLSDPSGIAGIAAMANKSHILMDFRDMDLAKHDQIHEKLKHRRYNLYKSCLWQGEYIKHGTERVDHGNVKNPHPMMLRLFTGIIFILTMLAFLGFIPVVMFTPANVVTNKLPWLLTALATVIKLIWGALECDVRTIEPFYILSRRHAPSSVLTLDYTAAAYGYLPFRAFLDRNYLVALVGFGSIMTDVLTVCVSSFSVNGKEFVKPGRQSADGAGGGDQTETFRSFWISFGVASFILLFLVTSASLVYARRRHPFLPREPSTIASVLAFIHQSKMLYDFVNTETMGKEAMEKHLRGKGKRYGLGWFRGRDGEDHCGVDEEELSSDYKHGVPYQKSHDPWTGWGV